MDDTGTRRQRVLCAPDKFRDALDAVQAAQALADGARDAGWQPVVHPMADGGEGSLPIVLAGGGRPETVPARDGLGRPIDAPWGLLPDGVAVVEAAAVIGLELLTTAERDVMRATSGGLAAPIRAAIEAGAGTVVVFLGGTANMDGGTGLLRGLGARLTDVDGRPLEGSGADLLQLRTLDLGPARELLGDVRLVVATDVTSPLVGPDGAAQVFGPQKGATPQQVTALDGGLVRLAALLGEVGSGPGSGAAGGLGGALLALGATARAGADVVAELTGFANRLADVDLCLTGEGRIDRGTLAGKAPAAVLERCRRAGVPCVLVGGAVTDDADELYAAGAAGVFAIGRGPCSLTDAVARTAADLRRSARAICGTCRPAS